jgi:glycosyltransferase involved in cell wall biosynthesis
LPVVATDVGACRELLEGRGPEDRALGPSGLLTAIADPQEMASALVRLLRDPALRARLAEAGAARVGRYYRQSDIIERYRALYRQHIEADPAAVAAAGAAGAGS